LKTKEKSNIIKKKISKPLEEKLIPRFKEKEVIKPD
jgi:hypothetical protein